ncbi:MAG: hypothetical protein Phog2KO_36720 [Phototrophicaceae bacterium]
MFRYLKTLLILFGLLFASSWLNIAQEQDSSTSPISVFAYDTCAPPCWMGLIPGESTASDVEAMLAENQDLIDPESISMSVARLESGEFAIDPDTNEVIRATYTFDVATPYFNTMGTTSRVLISERSVYEIAILSHERISINEIINNLGEPDFVRLYVLNGGTNWLAFIYLDLQIRINFNQPDQTCNVKNVTNNMTLFTARFLSSSAVIGEFGLLDYLSSQSRDVPLDLWQSWLNGEVDMSCEEAWALLPEPEITPAPEVTEASNEE